MARGSPPDVEAPLTVLGLGRTAQKCLASFFLGALVPALYLTALQPTSPQPSSGGSGGRGDWSFPHREEVCATPAYPIDGIDSDWNRMKSVPPVALCTVQGFPIEHLEPEFNFRRAYALGYTSDVEDKQHLLPFLRATRDIRLSTRQRRVLIDMGGKQFNSSVGWFLRHYPLSFSEVYVFQASEGIFHIPPPSPTKEVNTVLTLDDNSRAVPWGRLDLPSFALERVHLREVYVSTKDVNQTASGSPNSVNITRVIKEELQLTRHDTVIVKMDIEWAEWDILPSWLDDVEMPYIVDELFVEVHYQHPTMFPSIWNKGPSREKALQLYENLRARGFFAHPWP